MLPGLISENILSDTWILIVEDDENDMKLIMRALEASHRPERAVACFSAFQALTILGESKTVPALVLLDGRLTGTSSLEFLSILREKNEARFVPVVFFSGQSDPSFIAEVLSNGANSYVSKAFGYEQIMDELKTLFRYWLDLHRSPSAFPR
jgi:PleD family two-component response regulator